MENQLHIPKKLKLGTQKRSDTYSGILGFLTYELPDGTNKHKKSWDSWRDSTLAVKEFDNEPTEGFVLNKREGGGGRWSYSEREAKIRVWDPRGFEFEITIENMLDILAQCGSIPGKGLEGDFVYGYDGTKVFLVPTKSESYKKSMVFTDLSAKKVEAKDLILGATYVTKKVKNVIYMGYYQWMNTSLWSNTISVEKKHVFYDKDKFITLEVKDLATCIDETPTHNYAELVTKMETCGYYFKSENIKISEVKPQYSQFSGDYYPNNNNFMSSGKNSYYGEIFWLKKDDKTYEGVRLKLTFPERDNSSSSRYSYNYRSVKPNGIQLVYCKKFVKTDDGFQIKKSSKKDEKIYTLDEIKEKLFFGIVYNATELHQAERKNGYGSSYNDRIEKELA